MSVPTTTRYRVDSLPAELKALDRWVVFQITQEPSGKTKKLPVIAGMTGKHPARADDPKTWRSFAEAHADAEVRGLYLAFVFDRDVPYFFVDADGVIEDESIRPDAKLLVDTLDTYTETSVSGTGLHIIGKGTFPDRCSRPAVPTGCKAIELYPLRGARFCIFTGDVLVGQETIKDREHALLSLFPPRAAPHANGSTSGAGYQGSRGELTDLEVKRIVRWALPLWVNGRRHHMALHLSGYLGKSGVPRAQAAAIIERCAADDSDPGAKLAACHDTYDDLEAGADISGWHGLLGPCGLSEHELAPLKTTLDAFWKRNSAEESSVPHDDEPIIAGVRCSDVGNAEQLASRLVGRFRSVPAAKTWRIFKDGRWQSDTYNAVAQEAIRSIIDLYGRLADVEDAKARKRLRDHLQRSESQRAIQAAMSLAMTDPRIASAEGDFDARPGLLNVRNGTIELATCTFRDHDPDDLLTKQAPVDFDPDAAAPRWEQFIAEIMPDQAQRDWLQLYLGYVAAGDPVEQIVAMAYGEGQNGKSTMIDVLCGLMGPYAMRSDVETFLTQRNNAGGGAATPDLARLPGVRFLFAAEPGAGRRLNAGRVKEVSGGEHIVARHLYGAPFEFTPQFNLWISTNKKPVVPGNDPALWRRLRLVPFAVKVPEDRRILGLAHTILTTEASGVLNWILEGLRVWREIGRLPIVEAIQQATEDYRTESDEVGLFIEQRCQVGKDLRVQATELYQEFVRWYGQEIGGKAPSQTAFGRDLGERGYDSYREGTNYRIGLSLISEHKVNTSEDRR